MNVFILRSTSLSGVGADTLVSLRAMRKSRADFTLSENQWNASGPTRCVYIFPTWETERGSVKCQLCQSGSRDR